jgi:anti-sigma B factor antagonist
VSTQIIAIDHRRFDYSVGRVFHERLQRAWAAGATTIALDFTECVSLDSLGVSILVAAHRARPAGTRIIVCGLSEAVREVIEVTRLHRIFDVYASADAARHAA